MADRPAADQAPDWNGMAARLDVLAEDLMSAAPAFGEDLDEAAMELWSITLRHYAIQLRQKGED